jgi:hypothetical protein
LEEYIAFIFRVSMNEPNKIPAWKQVANRAELAEMGLLATCFHAGSVLGSFFYPEDEGNMLL